MVFHWKIRKRQKLVHDSSIKTKFMSEKDIMTENFQELWGKNWAVCSAAFALSVSNKSELPNCCSYPRELNDDENLSSTLAIWTVQQNVTLLKIRWQQEGQKCKYMSQFHKNSPTSCTSWRKLPIRAEICVPDLRQDLIFCHRFFFLKSQ